MSLPNFVLFLITAGIFAGTLLLVEPIIGPLAALAAAVFALAVLFAGLVALDGLNAGE